MTEEKLSAVEKADQPSMLIEPDLLAACIHCGLCLPACPTYLASGRETESPRGRIYLLNQWNEGRLPLDNQMFEHIDSCLGCLGCQTACPSGVQYEKIINQARPYLAQKRSWWTRAAMRTVFQWILPNYLLLRLGGFFLQLWQKLKIDRWLTGLVENQASAATDDSPLDAPHLIPRKTNFFMCFAQWNAFLPSVPVFKKLPQRAEPQGSPTGIMQLFTGCMMDIFYNHVNKAAMDLLLAQGRSVENRRQTCCGALAFHAGEADIAARLAKQNIEFFAGSEGPIVVTAAGCGAMLKEYNHLLQDEPEWSTRAADFSKRVIDITEALAAGEFYRPAKTADRKPIKVAYHAACHLAHAQSVRVPPAELLKLLSSLTPPAKDTGSATTFQSPSENAEPATALVTLIPLKDAEHCCGSAGIYNLMHPEMALKVLDLKMDNIARTNADVVVSTNPGCLLQLQTGVRRRGLSTKIKHLCELLATYYC